MNRDEYLKSLLSYKPEPMDVTLGVRLPSALRAELEKLREESVPAWSMNRFTVYLIAQAAAGMRAQLTERVEETRKLMKKAGRRRMGQGRVK